MKRMRFSAALTALILAFALLSCTVFAVSDMMQPEVESKTDLVEVTVDEEKIVAVNSAGEPVEITLKPIEDPEIALTPEAAAQILGSDVDESSLLVVWQSEVEASDLPVTVTLTVEGVQDNQEMYAYYYNGTEWEMVGASTGGEITITLKGNGPIALVLSSIVWGFSPNTGVSFSDLPLVTCASALTLSGLAFRKRRS